jgi:Aromatic-ring-opening dioxygenase LigAB, LigA subunit
MSSYHLNRLLFNLKMSEPVLKKARTDFAGLLDEYDLTAEEKEALRSGDPRKLRALGAHGMVALYILRLSPEFQDNIYWEQK